MCSKLLLSTFILFCQNYLYSQTDTDITLKKCIKAYDICVDMEYWSVLDNSVIERSQEEIDQIALDKCAKELSSKNNFRDFYLENRCGYNDSFN